MYAIVDIETTGGHASAHGITEIAILIHDGERVVQQYETLINPMQRIPNFITALTGISNAMVASAPRFDEVAGEIYNLLEGNVFVAHNVNFDHSFLATKLRDCGYRLDVKKICTVRLTRKAFPGLSSYSLGKICKDLEIVISQRHRAGGDARATAMLFDRILINNGSKHIDEMLRRTSGDQWLPLHLERERIERLPQKPGVYYFHDNKRKVIYVGKAVNLRRRVTSHFIGTDGGNRRQQFLRKIHDISYRECTSELHAIVLESTEIRRLWPTYNYSQKKASPAFALYTFEDSRGLLRLAIDKKKTNLEAVYKFNMLGEGRTMLKKLVIDFEIEPSLCFLESGGSKISAIDHRYHNEKVRNALEALKRKLPTFSVFEEGENGQILYMHIERGCFYGMGYLANKVESLDKLKELLDPFPDNDFIRNSLFEFAKRNPHQVRKW